MVEFIERTDAGFAQTGSYFQSVSEIGIAVADVPAITIWLGNEFGLLSFAKTNSQSDFNAVGDDYGLFILAQTGRRWLFTDIAACEQAFTVQIGNPFGPDQVVTAALLQQQITGNMNLNKTYGKHSEVKQIVTCQ